MCVVLRAAFRMLKTVVSTGESARRPATGSGQDSGTAEAQPRAAELSARVQELEAQLRQRNEEIRVLAAMRLPTTSGWHGLPGLLVMLSSCRHNVTHIERHAWSILSL